MGEGGNRATISDSQVDRKRLFNALKNAGITENKDLRCHLGLEEPHDGAFRPHQLDQLDWRQNISDLAFLESSGEAGETVAGLSGKICADAVFLRQNFRAPDVASKIEDDARQKSAEELLSRKNGAKSRDLSGGEMNSFRNTYSPMEGRPELMDPKEDTKQKQHQLLLKLLKENKLELGIRKDGRQVINPIEKIKPSRSFYEQSLASDRLSRPISASSKRSLSAFTATTTASSPDDRMFSSQSRKQQQQQQRSSARCQRSSSKQALLVPHAHGAHAEGKRYLSTTITSSYDHSHEMNYEASELPPFLLTMASSSYPDGSIRKHTLRSQPRAIGSMQMKNGCRGTLLQSHQDHQHPRGRETSQYAYRAQVSRYTSDHDEDGARDGRRVNNRPTSGGSSGGGYIYDDDIGYNDGMTPREDDSGTPSEADVNVEDESDSFLEGLNQDEVYRWTIPKWPFDADDGDITIEGNKKCKNREEEEKVDEENDEKATRSRGIRSNSKTASIGVGPAGPHARDKGTKMGMMEPSENSSSSGGRRVDRKSTLPSYPEDDRRDSRLSTMEGVEEETRHLDPQEIQKILWGAFEGHVRVHNPNGAPDRKLLAGAIKNQVPAHFHAPRRKVGFMDPDSVTPIQMGGRKDWYSDGAGNTMRNGSAEGGRPALGFTN